MLDTLALRTLRGFQGVKTLGRGLDFALGMGGEITPPEDPFRRWISVDPAVSAVILFQDVATPFAGLDNRTTGSTIKATAGLFHKDAVRTRFNRDTFHCFARSFLYMIDTNQAPTRQAHCLLAEAVRLQSSAEESLSW